VLRWGLRTRGLCSSRGSNLGFSGSKSSERLSWEYFCCCCCCCCCCCSSLGKEGEFVHGYCVVPLEDDEKRFLLIPNRYAKGVFEFYVGFGFLLTWKGYIYASFGM
jgi:hypothetical protein